MDKALKPSKVRVVAETAIASFAGALGVLTIFWHDWIEALTGWDPDHHNGSFEWMIVAVLLIIAAVAGSTARRDWRVRAAASQSPSLDNTLDPRWAAARGADGYCQGLAMSII